MATVSINSGAILPNAMADLGSRSYPLLKLGRQFTSLKFFFFQISNAWYGPTNIFDIPISPLLQRVLPPILNETQSFG